MTSTIEAICQKYSMMGVCFKATLKCALLAATAGYGKSACLNFSRQSNVGSATVFMSISTSNEIISVPVMEGTGKRGLLY